MEILGVVKLVTPVPLESIEPPDEAAYQSIVSPEPGVAEMVTVPEPQREALPAVGVDGEALTVAVTAVLVADTQPVVVFLDSA